jgi:hypothetical protein
MRVVWRCVATLAAGSALLLSGCDDQTRAALENGIIDSSTSFVGALLQALIQLAGEQP